MLLIGRDFCALLSFTNEACKRENLVMRTSSLGTYTGECSREMN